MFAYCGNNPVNAVDRLGLAFEVFGWISDAASAAGTWLSNTVSTSGEWVENHIVAPVCSAWDYVTNTDEQVVLDSKHFAFYRGALVIRTNGDRSGTFGIIYLTRETNNRNNPEDNVRHEYGHIIQMQQLGVVNFALTIGIPSWREWGSGSYYDKPWEVTADIYGGALSRPHTSEVIFKGFEYLLNAKYMGVFSWFGIK